MILHIARSWSSEGKSVYKKINEIVCAFLTVAFGIYYPFLILRLGLDYPGVVFPTAVEELTFLGNLLLFGVTLGIIGWALSAKIRTLRNPELLKEKNNYSVFCERFLKEYPAKNKLKRRITHILPVGVVCGIIIIFSFFKFLLGDAWFNYALFFTIIIGLDFAFTFALGDIIRLLDFSWMPPTGLKLYDAGLVPEELDTFSSTSVMVFSFGPFVFFSFPIFFIEVLIAAVADAMASTIGILTSDRNHKFPKSSTKSIEGYIGGICFTFGCTFFGAWFSNYYGLSNWSFSLIFGLAIILSIVFFLIDLITSKIKLQDNYLNPLLTGFVIIVFLLISKQQIF